MKKICIIGNSHLGSIKKGLDSITKEINKEKYSIVFFGAPNDGLLKTKLENNAIVPTENTIRDDFILTSGGLDRIDLNGFNYFVIHGAFGVSTHLFEHSRVRYYSRAVYEKAFLEQFNNTTSKVVFHLIDLIRSASSDASILVTPRPFLSYESEFPDLSPIEEGVYSDYIRLFSRMGARFLPQPKNTTIKAFASDPMFSLGGGVHLHGHITNDDIHKNALYGEYYLRDLLINFEKS